MHTAAQMVENRLPTHVLMNTVGAIVWGVLKTSHLFKKWSAGGFKGVYRRRQIICAIFFWWSSFRLHIQSFVFAPYSAIFDFVPLARDPP